MSPSITDSSTQESKLNECTKVVVGHEKVNRPPALLHSNPMFKTAMVSNVLTSRPPASLDLKKKVDYINKRAPFTIQCSFI